MCDNNCRPLEGRTKMAFQTTEQNKMKLILITKIESHSDVIYNILCIWVLVMIH